MGVESVFIRFDTRSLKDVPVTLPEYGPLVMEEHARLQVTQNQ